MEDGLFWYGLDRSILHQSGLSLLGPPASEMFADQDVCCLSQQALMAEGFGDSLRQVLRALIEAGFMSKQAGTSRVPDTYQLCFGVQF